MPSDWNKHISLERLYQSSPFFHHFKGKSKTYFEMDIILIKICFVLENIAPIQLFRFLWLTRYTYCDTDITTWTFGLSIVNAWTFWLA